eukprot:9581691-Alexandrium_andersonii.AAC.1
MQTTANTANARHGEYAERVPNPKRTYEASVRADGAPGGVHHGGALVYEALRAIAAPVVVVQ